MFKLYLFVFCFIFYITCTLSNQSKLLFQWHKFPQNFFLNTSILQPECQKAYKRFLKDLSENNLDALKSELYIKKVFEKNKIFGDLPLVFDATAKLPSGILNGNIIQYGDFNECMEVKNAQYCLAEINFETLSPQIHFKDLIQSFNFFKDKFDDPAHRIPGFTLAHWAFCLPEECSPEDLVTSLKSNFGVEAQIREGMCQKSGKDARILTRDDYIARIFFTFVTFAVFLGTLLDFCVKKTNFKSRNGTILNILMCFSLRQNIRNFLEIKENNQNEISGLHGIRFLNALALLMSHKSISLFFNPFINRTAAIDKLNRPWTIIAKNAIVYTDVFMLISGLLNANALLTDLFNNRGIKFKEKFINRIFRILPNVIALILFCTYILPLMGSGPLWPIVVDYHSKLCKKHMWKNFFFIHNYFGFENMCLTHTHQLGIDMQLFLVTPIFVYLIFKFRNFGLFFMFFVALLSTILRFFVSYKYELTSVIYFGIPVSKMFSSATLSYILPTHRATIYLIGVYLAYLLKTSKSKISFTKFQIISLWSFFLPIFLLSWLGPYHMVVKNYVYNKFEASSIVALYPIFWGSAVAFGIYAINRNISGWLGTIFSWKYFQISTKLAYALYLVQFPVFFYNVGMRKHVDEYQNFLQLEIFETLVILLWSLLLVLFIEIPFQNIKKVLFDNKEKTKMKRKEYKSG